MYFYIPVKIYEEENCITNHKKELSSLGTKALLVTGKRSSRLNGSLGDVMKALESEGRSFTVFDEIEENPSIETVMAARDAGLAAGADFVVGIGGGSPMDAAKAIALMMYHKDKGADYLYEKDADSTALPVAAVPTTCGTGSEATPFAILTIHEKRTKSSLPHKIFPALALLDAKYLSTAPKKVLCDTAVDALGHFIESYINSNASDYSRMFVTEGLSVWGRSRDVLTGKREAKLQDYRNMLNASTMAGMAITHTGTSLPHGLSYYVTYEQGTAHGKAIGRFLCGYLKAAGEKERELILSRAGFDGLKDFEQFYDTVCGKESLSDALKEMAAEGVLSSPEKLNNCPFAVDKAILYRIME
ncbi:iron-containing alcohol dehydrogenase family protein [[Clostridium] symbiosum]|uniref:iron-containing alcohol dehydrogenase family protein n=1 Tax=Clostridium symbiosum TaxID=1512 RepID=UPI001D06592E|nr:iron-containing alcohol dehydrogenase family protein [[Clostridium] symbiosum]MCB6607527.1 iron-containing alcohol dehydrogenase [[Clostridium] symbiosum]MCB6930727.1 iron-containing alcohol dehydrogenase [[Clostridium] symbiosum]